MIDTVFALCLLDLDKVLFGHTTRQNRLKAPCPVGEIDLLLVLVIWRGGGSPINRKC